MWGTRLFSCGREKEQTFDGASLTHVRWCEHGQAGEVTEPIMLASVPNVFSCVRPFWSALCHLPDRTRIVHAARSPDLEHPRRVGEDTDFSPDRVVTRRADDCLGCRWGNWNGD